MDLKHLEMDKHLLTGIEKNRQYNARILEFYETMKQDVESEEQQQKIRNKIESIESCNSIFEIDFYKKQKIKDFKRTNLCKDKFCNNCKKVKQASRMAKFIPEIEKFKDSGLYHLVLTSPNVPADELEKDIKRQLKAFPHLIEFFKGKKKIKGLDFEQYGYKGAIRSLEVTYKGNSYHPHLHVLLVAENLDITEKTIVNSYSIDHFQGGRIVRKFSDLEILIQKIWRLLLTGERVTKKNVESLDIGYSCMVDEFEENDYFELFKYMTKNSSESFMTYENFKTLYRALHNVRQIQGYGCLFRLNDKDIEDEVSELYDKIVENLKKIEDAELIYESPSNLLADNDNLLISRKKIHEYLRLLKND